MFANAGLIEKSVMFDLSKPSLLLSSSSSARDEDEEEEEVLPPPRPDYTAIEVNLQGAIDTVHLARHYMLRSPEKEKGAIVITASCSSVWPTYWAPIYSASKCESFFFFLLLSTKQNPLRWHMKGTRITTLGWKKINKQQIR